MRHSLWLGGQPYAFLTGHPAYFGKKKHAIMVQLLFPAADLMCYTDTRHSYRSQKSTPTPRLVADARPRGARAKKVFGFACLAIR